MTKDKSMPGKMGNDNGLFAEPVDGDIDETIADRIELGRMTLGALHGESGLGYVERLARSCPEMADLLLAFPYGSLYARPGLDIRGRQIATIAALTTLGDCEHELVIHIRSSLRAGLTREEIIEIILQMAAYAGFPRALAAIKAAALAFAGADDDGSADATPGSRTRRSEIPRSEP